MIDERAHHTLLFEYSWQAAAAAAVYQPEPFSTRPERGKRERNWMRAIAGDGFRTIWAGFSLDRVTPK